MKKAKFRKSRIAIVAVFILVIGAGTFAIFRNFSYRTISKKAVDQSVLAAATTVPKPSPSPSPSPTATPMPSSTPTPTGFCLNVPVIFYHHVEPMAQAKAEGHGGLTVDNNTFDSQMAYLVSRGWKTISADELADALLHHKQLGKVVVVTLDDGYADAFNFAYPIAKKYGVHLNLMIPTGLMNNNGYLSWQQLSEMVGGGVTAYDHTWSHSSLPADTVEKAQFEILTAKKQLETNLGKTVNIFAYPYGSANTRDVGLLRSDGFVAAFTTIPGTLQCETYIMTLHRTRIGNSPLSSYGL